MTEFETIFRKYHPPLSLYAQKFTGDEQTALDIVQDVFLKIWEDKKLQSDSLALKSYLFNSVRNACFNFLKHEQVKQKHATIARMEIEFYQSGEKSLIEDETMDSIQKAIDSLPDHYKEIIELSRFEGLKNKEIAEKLNIPVRTVETRLFRGLLALRKSISERILTLLFSLHDTFR